jgi:hypothetical protein
MPDILSLEECTKEFLQNDFITRIQYVLEDGTVHEFLRNGNRYTLVINVDGNVKMERDPSTGDKIEYILQSVVQTLRTQMESGVTVMYM